MPRDSATVFSNSSYQLEGVQPQVLRKLCFSTAASTLTPGWRGVIQFSFWDSMLCDILSNVSTHISHPSKGTGGPGHGGGAQGHADLGSRGRMTLTFDLGGGGEQLRLRPCFLLLFRGLFLLIFFLGTSVLPNRTKEGKTELRIRKSCIVIHAIKRPMNN